MNPTQALMLAMKEKELQELIRELIVFRSKKGSEPFNEKLKSMREMLKEDT
jgi:hypothetical protein